LEEQLEGCYGEDPALFLHTACLLLFSLCTGALLQASGKYVPQIIGLLISMDKVTQPDAKLLRNSQELVVAFIKGSQDLDRASVWESLNAVKLIINGMKK